MGLNLDKMRAKLDKLNGVKPTKEKSGFLESVEGERDVRIIQTALDETNDPFREAWMHWGLGVRGFLCPKKNFGEPCKACEMSYQSWNVYNETQDPEDRKIAKAFMSKRRFYSPVVAREHGKTVGEPVWFGYSKTNYEKMLGWVLSPKVGDFTDPAEGRDITITYTPKERSKTDFATTDLMFDLSRTELGTRDEVLQLIDQLPDLYDLMDRRTSAEVEEIVLEFINKGSDGGASVSRGTTAPSKPKTDEIGDQFNDLLRS